VRVNTQAAPHQSGKSLNCDTIHQVNGRATTAEHSDYLKKTLMRNMFVMACEAVKNRETMSLSVKNTALWALKVPLEEMCRFGYHVPVLEHTSDVSLGTQITTGATSQDGGYMRNSQ